jgi:hypothetical protein
MNPLIPLIWVHFVADFLLQTDKMATNKSTSNKWLGIHVAVYTIPFLCWGWKFALINGAAHFVTDWFTSRGTSYLWKREKRHWFFALIGLDQAIHMTTLALTYQWLVR